MYYWTRAAIRWHGAARNQLTEGLAQLPCVPRQFFLALPRLRHALHDSVGIQHSLPLAPLIVIPHQRMLRLRLLGTAGGETRNGQQHSKRAHRERSIGKLTVLAACRTGRQSERTPVLQHSATGGRRNAQNATLPQM
jgi:hypothetical protein